MLSTSASTSYPMPCPRALNPAFEPAKRRLLEEQRWRRPDLLGLGILRGQAIFVSRWVNDSEGCRDEEAASFRDRHVVSVALRAARVKLCRDKHIVFEGTMPAGMLHLSAPSAGLKARFTSRCDFIHFYVENDYVAKCRETLFAPLSHQETERQDDVLIHDPLAEQLGRTLVAGDNAGNEAYEESVARTILMRVLGKQPHYSKVGALQRWRLKRVDDYVSNHMDERISLSDLARAAGLSRMHFAAQFKAATGCSPHDYLLQHRIEFAKATMLVENMPLAEVALSAGFQAQPHFTTVFKRLTGDTPAHWRRAQLASS